MSSDLAHFPVSSVAAVLRGRCPHCGQGKLFEGFLEIAPSCNVCGLNYDFADAGDGPAFFVTMIGGAIVVGSALWTEVVYQPPYWVHAVIFLPLTLIVCVGALRPLKALLIGLQYRNKAGQGQREC